MQLGKYAVVLVRFLFLGQVIFNVFVKLSYVNWDLILDLIQLSVMDVIHTHIRNQRV